MRKLFWIFLVSFVFRLFLAPLSYHSDAFDSLNWGKDLEKFGVEGFYFRDIPDAGPPNYPPGFYWILFINQLVYRKVLDLLWWTNVSVQVFPSNFFLWLESDLGRIFFNKLPSILADLGLGYLIYLFAKNLGKTKLALMASAFFLFSPPVWYNSSVWGQTDSLFALPILAAFYLIQRKKFVWAMAAFVAGFLIKPTSLILLPVFLIWLIMKADFSSLKKGLLVSLPLFYLVHIPFNPTDSFSWIVKLYSENVHEILGYVVANAFNFWALVLGFGPQYDTVPFFGIPAVNIGYFIFGLFLVFILWRLFLKVTPKRVLLASTVIVFAGFLFLTKIHERHFYLALPFFAVLAGLDKNLAKPFWASSLIHFTNLYHFWWVPKFDFLIKFFSHHTVENILIVVNMGIFFWLLNYFSRDDAKTT